MATSRTRWRRARRRTALGIAICLIGLTPATAAAGSDGNGAPAPHQLPYGMSALTYHRMLAQIPLEDAVTRIRQAVDRPGDGHDGLVDLAIDADHNLVTVYWHGQVPADIGHLLADLRQRMTIRVIAAPYSAAQLASAVDRVIHTRLSTGAVSSAGPLPDGSGIQVGLPGNALPAQATARQFFGVDVPVRVVHTQYLAKHTRNDDQPPYWGGAAIYGPSSACSTGFGVHSTVDSRRYILTAGHCGSIGDGFTNGVGSQTVGKMTHNTTLHDDAMIETNSGDAYYDGPGINAGDTSNYKYVAGQAPSAVGQWLCESGAFGGVICGLQISALNQTVPDPVDGITVSNVAEATSSSGVHNTDGDSGGPVFSLAANNRVTAKGIILGVTYDDQGHAWDAFMTIDWVSHDFLVTVNTAP